MRFRGLIFVNTALITAYISIVSLTDMHGLSAFLLLIVFPCGILSQFILSGLFRPVKVDFEYLIILSARLIAFLTVPIQNNIFIYILSVGITFCMDFWQYSDGKINEKFEGRTYTEREDIQAKLLAKTIISFGVSASIFLKIELFTNIISIIVVLYIMKRMGNDKIKSWCAVETGIFVILRLSREFISYNKNLTYIIVLLFLLIGSRKYYMIYPKKRKNE